MTGMKGKKGMQRTYTCDTRWGSAKWNYKVLWNAHFFQPLCTLHRYASLCIACVEVLKCNTTIVLLFKKGSSRPGPLQAKDSECGDWFRECTLFQLNRQHCHGFHPPREYDSLLRKKEGREFEPEAPNQDAPPDVQPAFCKHVYACLMPFSIFRSRWLHKDTQA